MLSQDGKSSVAVLVSGGIDSAVLLAELCQSHDPVYPLFVRGGMIWEETELMYLRRYLSAVARPGLRPLKLIEVPVRDLYGDHWSTTGQSVPDAVSPDDAVYLPGRNLLLTAKAAVWCCQRRIDLLALALLRANPFPDSTDEFFGSVESLVCTAMNSVLSIRCPFSAMTKVEVIQRGWGLPLEWTFSCISPVDQKHCGECNKCGERQRGFADAGLPDPTDYAI